MPEDVENQRLDHLLADFTDRLLRQKQSTSADTEPSEDETVDQLHGNEELVRLQRMVVRLDRTLPKQPPARVFADRLHAALIAEYRRLQEAGDKTQAPRAQGTWHSVWQQWMDAFRPKPRTLTLRLALLAAVLLILMLFTIIPVNVILPAAAGINAFQPWVVLVLSAVCVAVIVWLVREKK